LNTSEQSAPDRDVKEVRNSCGAAQLLPLCLVRVTGINDRRILQSLDFGNGRLPALARSDIQFGSKAINSAFRNSGSQKKWQHSLQ
jgi:hypothetical protein